MNGTELHGVKPVHAVLKSVEHSADTAFNIADGSPASWNLMGHQQLQKFYCTAQQWVKIIKDVEMGSTPLKKMSEVFIFSICILLCI
jgi:hypothetical protein